MCLWVSRKRAQLPKCSTIPLRLYQLYLYCSTEGRFPGHRFSIVLGRKTCWKKNIHIRCFLVQDLCPGLGNRALSMILQLSLINTIEMCQTLRLLRCPASPVHGSCPRMDTVPLPTVLYLVVHREQRLKQQLILKPRNQNASALFKNTQLAAQKNCTQDSGRTVSADWNAHFTSPNLTSTTTVH